MADHLSADINIPLNYVMTNEELFNMIEEHCQIYSNILSLLSAIENRLYEDDLISVCVTGEPGEEIFCLHDSEASYGYFQEIEEFCFEHQIPFDRSTYGDYEMGGDFTYWYRPGMQEGYDCMTPNNRSHVSVKFIRSVLDSHPEDVTDREALDDLMAKIDSLVHDSPRNHLRNWCSRGMIG